ncbi:zinc finger, CCHC-type, retrotransposon gag domain protein [Tanacetum coccineum]
MATIHNKEVLKATTSKHAGTSASDADKVKSDDDNSSSSSEDLNFREFSKDEKDALNGSWKDRASYCDFTACDVQKFTGDLNLIVSTRWITVVEGAFHTSECEDKNKVSSCSWKEFKEMFNVEYAPVEEIDKIREEFHGLVQTNETMNELWKKFNDMVPYCPEYHGNEKLKVDKFQRMLKDEIREVISPFKYTTLEDLLGRARIREADLLRKKNNEKKELKRKQEHDDAG